MSSSTTVELLESGSVSDVALITKAGVCLYAMGEQFHEASLDGCVAPVRNCTPRLSNHYLIAMCFVLVMG